MSFSGILQPDVTKRLGSMKSGTAGIKEHAWFDGFSWQDCYDRKTRPFPIQLRSDEDTSAFDDYSGERLPQGKPLKDTEEAKFAEYPFF